jgi:cytochrome bd-I ubiquinol oxidase subunit X
MLHCTELARAAAFMHGICFGRLAVAGRRSLRRFCPARQGEEKETKAMWYFSWILGIGVALGFGIINAMWLDANSKLTSELKSGQRDGAPAGEASTRRA